MNKIAKFIAAVGTSMAFVSAMAHIGFAFMLVVFFPHWYTVLAIVITAAVKEYWFDSTYEQKQTFLLNSADFLGYVFGAVLAANHLRLL